MSNEVEWCNWTFEECLTPSNKWLVSRDCGFTVSDDGEIGLAGKGVVR